MIVTIVCSWKFDSNTCKCCDWIGIKCPQVRCSAWFGKIWFIYYCFSWCPTPKIDQAEYCANLALLMLDTLKLMRLESQVDLSLPISIHTGSVNGDLVEIDRFWFDIDSYSVLMAQMLMATCEPARAEMTLCNIVTWWRTNHEFRVFGYDDRFFVQIWDILQMLSITSVTRLSPFLTLQWISYLTVVVIGIQANCQNRLMCDWEMPHWPLFATRNRNLRVGDTKHDGHISSRL